MRKVYFFLSVLLIGSLMASVDVDFDEIQAEMYPSSIEEMPEISLGPVVVDFDETSAQMYLNQVQEEPAQSSGHITTLDVQQYQAEYDEQYFDAGQDYEKLRRILFQVVESVGKLASYCEAKEHGKKSADPSQLVGEVLPDLLMHSLQMANLFEVDLGAKYEERIDANAKRITANRIMESLKAK